MIEYIKSLIMGIVTGITSPLAVSSSGHFSIGNRIIGFSEDSNVSALYYSLFMLVFSIVMLISFRKLYAKLFKGASKKAKNYKLRLNNLIISIAVGIVLFIPIPGLGKSLTDYFNMFFDSGNILNGILLGTASVFTGLILAVSVWYAKNGKGRRKKSVPTKSALRMALYSVPAYIIPGTSKVALSSANLVLCDVNTEIIFREIYFYLAPQIFVINLIRAVMLFFSGVHIDGITLVIGAVAVALSSLLILSIIRKTDSDKLLMFFSIYSVVFGIGAVALTLTPILSGV